MQDIELVDRLNAVANRLPAALTTFAECLARWRERQVAEGENFTLTECQRAQAQDILAALALGQTGKDIPTDSEGSGELLAIAERVRELRARKKSLEDELTAATAELVAAVGVGATLRGEEIRVRVGEPRLSVKVSDASQLPAQFLTLQPDRKAILEHVREVAEVPEGAQISETRATVYFSKP